jgi:hypothetical protein
VGRCGLDPYGLGSGPVAGSGEHGNETWCSTKWGDSLE